MASMIWHDGRAERACGLPEGHEIDIVKLPISDRDPDDCPWSWVATVEIERGGCTWTQIVTGESRTLDLARADATAAYRKMTRALAAYEVP